jgi:hypothetical protein
VGFAIRAALVVVLSATAASAQPRDHVFAGVGGALLKDEVPRVVLGGISGEMTTNAWFVDGGVFVAPRIGVGFEFVRSSTAETDTQTRSGTFTAIEREFAVVGDLRLVAIDKRPVSLVAVAGIGRLFGTDERQFEPIDPRSSSSSTVFDRTLTVWLVGFEVTVRPLPHLVIAPTVRLYRLTGGTPTFPKIFDDPLGVLDTSSTRFIVGLAVRTIS